jgi:hypothetical protein
MVGGQRHALAASPLGRNPVTHCTVGWVGPRTGLDESPSALQANDNCVPPSFSFVTQPFAVSVHFIDFI